jgi:CheY-like chemotaxis protein
MMIQPSIPTPKLLSYPFYCTRPQAMLGHMLRQLGASHVTTVNNGRDAVAAALCHPFDIVLMDGMPAVGYLECTGNYFGFHTYVFVLLRGQSRCIAVSAVHMPEVGGLEAAHAIRTYESLAGAGAQNQKKLPIIAMSADATDDLEYRCLAVGMSGMNDCMGDKRARGLQMPVPLTHWRKPLHGRSQVALPSHSGKSKSQRF